MVQRWSTSHVTRTPLSRSKGQRSTCRGGAYCGGLPHSLFLQCFDTVVVVVLAVVLVSVVDEKAIFYFSPLVPKSMLLLIRQKSTVH